MAHQMGKLIVLEGTDGSGKSTQFARLCARLAERGQAHRHLVFPQYEEESSALIRMYLRGDFGQNPADVNPYAASAFYAVDRYASFRKDWSQDYEKGILCLADRYTTSNAVYQAAKLAGAERQAYIRWLFDFEYTHMGLPKPTQVFYLDLPTEHSLALLRQREGGRDIHEANEAYLAACRETALELAAREGWRVFSCLDAQGRLRSVADIHEMLWQALLPQLEATP